MLQMIIGRAKSFIGRVPGQAFSHCPFGLLLLSRMRLKVALAISAYSALPVAFASWANAMQAKVLEKILYGWTRGFPSLVNEK